MCRSTFCLLLATASLGPLLSGCSASSPQAPTPAVSTPAPVPSTPTNPTDPVRVEWQAPLPMSPAANAQTTRRPTLTVGNGERTGTPQGVTYLFEIATDASFKTLVASGRVSEGTGQTTFTPSADLPAGATYAWRAHASDSSGATSPLSVPRSFTAALKDDGQYRARLVVRSPAWCDTHFTVPTDNYPNQLPGWVKPDIGVDGMVVVSGDRLSYFGTPGWPGADSVRLFDLRWTDGTLSGPATGSVRPDSSEAVPPFRNNISVAYFSGHADGTAIAAGEWRGSFSGVVELREVGIRLDHVAAWQAGDFAWTLLPR